MAHSTSEMDICDIDRMLGVQEKRGGKCKTHGDYISSRIVKKGQEFWTDCPSCAEEESDRKERERQISAHKQWVKDRIAHLLESSGIPERFESASFESFQARNGKPQKALKSVADYASLVVSGDHEGRSLILCGLCGTGKTHLAVSAVKQVIEFTVKPAIYTTVPAVIRSIKSTWEKNSEVSESQVLGRLVNAELLVLDEVGVQKGSDFERQVAYDVINGRYEKVKPTIVISNLQPDEIEGFIGERVVDRLRENGGKAIVFDWVSYRKSGGKE